MAATSCTLLAKSTHTIVLLGQMEQENYERDHTKMHVGRHRSGKALHAVYKISCTEIMPQLTLRQVVGSSMYVMCGFHQQEDEYNTNDIFALDLRSWVWTKLSPGGVPPLKCDKLVGRGGWAAHACFLGSQIIFALVANLQIIVCTELVDPRWKNLRIRRIWRSSHSR